jgi:hypothetical protein
MGKQDFLMRVRDLVLDVTRARFEGSAHAKLMRAHGYADGYMRALLDAGLVDKGALLTVVGEARRAVVDAGLIAFVRGGLQNEKERGRRRATSLVSSEATAQRIESTRTPLVLAPCGACSRHHVTASELVPLLTWCAQNPVWFCMSKIS